MGRRAVSESQWSFEKPRAWTEQQRVCSEPQKSTPGALPVPSALAVKRKKSFFGENKIGELRKPLQEGATAQGILRRHRAGILAMAPLSLGETHRKDHASHQGAFSLHLLDNQPSGGRQVPPGLFQLGTSPPHQP